MKLILASTSPYRKLLLERLALPFDCVAPGVDEDAFKTKGLTPAQLAQTLAKEKAQAVAQRFPDALVIGGDQLAEVEGTILGKPGNEAHALSQLQSMQGKTHQLLTAVHLIGPGIDTPHLAVTKLHMRRLSEAELLSYLRLDRPYDCAGSYKIEERGIKLFSQIETDDMNTIMGLPLMWLQSSLLKHGFSFAP